MKTFQPNMLRFVRRGSLMRRQITGFVGDMFLSWEMMWNAAWRLGNTMLEQTEVAAPNQVGVNQVADDRIDAMRVSGMTTVKGDIYDVHAGMVAYRLEVPEEAMATTIASVAFRATTDKFSLGGVKVAIFFSNSPTPPRDFMRCRKGGTDDAIDDTGAFATSEGDFTVDPVLWERAVKQGANIPTRIGVLAAVQPLLLQNNPLSKEFTIDTSTVAKAYKYVYVIMSMFTPDAWRDQYYVEGSAMLHFASMALTTTDEFEMEEPVIPDPTFSEEYGWRVAMNMAVTAVSGSAPIVPTKLPSRFIKYKFENINVVDRWMGLDWGVRQAFAGTTGSLFLYGATGEGNEIPAPADESANAYRAHILLQRPSLAPAAWLDGKHVQVRRSVVAFSLPRDIPTDAHLWLKGGDEVFIGEKTKVRFIVFAGTSTAAAAITTAQFEVPAIWDGTTPNTSYTRIGMQDITGEQINAGWFGIKLTSATQRANVYVLATIIDAAKEDVEPGTTNRDIVGFVERRGLDLRDAHIAMKLTPSEQNGGVPQDAPTPVSDGSRPPPPFIPPPVLEPEAEPPIPQPPAPPADPDFVTEYGWRIALNAALTALGITSDPPVETRQLSYFVKYGFQSNNIEDMWLSMDYASRVLIESGTKWSVFNTSTVAESAVNNVDKLRAGVITINDRLALAPCAWMDGKAFNTRRSIVSFSCPRDWPSTAALWLRVGDEGFIGKKSKMRLLVYESFNNAIPSTDVTVWNGTYSASAVMGGSQYVATCVYNKANIELAGEQIAGWIRIPLGASSLTAVNVAAQGRFVHVCAMISDIAREDIMAVAGNPETRIGFVARIGFDLRNAHIATYLTPYELTPLLAVNPPVMINDGSTAPPIAPLAFKGFLKNGAVITEDVVVQDNPPYDMVYTAAFAGGNGTLFATGGAFWTLTGTGATILSQDSQTCRVRITRSGSFSLAWKAQNAATSPTQTISGSLPITTTFIPWFGVVSSGTITPTTSPTGAFTLSGVNVTKDGDPTTDYEIQWQKNEQNEQGAWTGWVKVAGATDTTYNPATLYPRTTRFRVRISFGTTAQGNAGAVLTGYATLLIS